MRIRTGHGPDDWSDNVPAAARSATYRSFAVVPAVTIGSMRPVVTGRVDFENRLRRHAAVGFVLHRTPKP